MSQFDGWMPLKAAAQRYGIHYETLRDLVNGGVLTRGRFTTARRGRVYLRISELEAWRTGGVDAVTTLRAAAKPPA